MKNKTLPSVVLILSDARGQYIPRDFVTNNYGEIAVHHCAKWGIKFDDAKILVAGPDSEFYWETWETVLNNAQFTDVDGAVYRLYQDGDLFGLCYEKMSTEEKQNFGFDLED